jgi:hypothetical protein
VKIVANENVDQQIDRLRANGHEVQFVAELDPASTTPPKHHRGNRRILGMTVRARRPRQGPFKLHSAVTLMGATARSMAR